jgi:hypothetical protein
MKEGKGGGGEGGERKKAGSYDKGTLVHVCLTQRKIHKRLLVLQPCKSLLQPIQKNTSARPSVQQLSGQPQSGATLVINLCTQRLLFPNILCNPPHFPFKSLLLPQPLCTHSSLWHSYSHYNALCS